MIFKGRKLRRREIEREDSWGKGLRGMEKKTEGR
jgi:hypothetical protein